MYLAARAEGAAQARAADKQQRLDNMANSKALRAETKEANDVKSQERADKQAEAALRNEGK